MLDTREKELEEERATSRRRLEQLERDLDEKCKEAHSVKVLHPYLKWGMYVGVVLLQAYTVTYIHTVGLYSLYCRINWRDLLSMRACTVCMSVHWWHFRLSG